MLVFHVSRQPLFDLSFRVFGQVDFVVEIELIHAGPNFGRDGPAKLRDKRQLVLFRRTLVRNTTTFKSEQINVMFVLVKLIGCMVSSSFNSFFKFGPSMIVRHTHYRSARN